VRLPFFLTAVLLTRPALAAVGPNAVWAPSAAAVTRLRDACVAQPVPDVRVCLLRFMAEAGAPAAALEFSRALDDEGWMTAYTPRGKVSVAEILRPFRANANAGVLLVGGDPETVDVSRHELLAALEEDSRLASIKTAHPEAAIWSADPAKPEPAERPGGGQRFLFEFPVRTCRACADLAETQVAFDFNGDGKYLGARLLTVRPSATFAVEGEVKRGKVFEAAVDAERIFRLKPFSEGWTIEVQDKGGNDYCAVVTPPYRGVNALTIFGNAPGEVRHFRCVVRREEQAEADKTLREVLWDGKATWKETDAAAQAHGRLAAGAQRGTLTITRLVLGNSGVGQRPWIESMAFRFELRPHGPAER
jgi:hypothetical protein